MENKVMYAYQMSLANGKIVIHHSEGLFTAGQSEDEKVLINSATLISMYEVDADGNPIKKEKQPEEVASEVVLPEVAE